MENVLEERALLECLLVMDNVVRSSEARAPWFSILTTLAGTPSLPKRVLPDLNISEVVAVALVVVPLSKNAAVPLDKSVTFW